MIVVALAKPKLAPPADLPSVPFPSLMKSAAPPMILIVLVLGSILFGAATPTDAAGSGAMGALVMALLRKTLDREALSSSSQRLKRPRWCSLS